MIKKNKIKLVIDCICILAIFETLFYTQVEFTTLFMFTVGMLYTSIVIYTLISLIVKGVITKCKRLK